MLLQELFDSISEKQIWGRRGTQTVRKYRCTSGMRKGRIVATAAQCFAAPNIKARISMKRTRAKIGRRMMRKAQRTRRTNPASRRLKALNK
ncbi:uncharacterized protein METZ01_LOCUS391145 [marine metagenome]|uniref:Uncharacterized protein n=1 Tax=marine metagenome TaxID=408172 RepID=A0A382UXA6_9ZZZZ